jgi:hypothetical protein
MPINKPILIDQIISRGDYYRSTLNKFPGDNWYCAKPLAYFSQQALVERIYHAWLILIGRAFAVQYMEDREKE